MRRNRPKSAKWHESSRLRQHPHLNFHFTGMNFTLRPIRPSQHRRRDHRDNLVFETNFPPAPTYVRKWRTKALMHTMQMPIMHVTQPTKIIRGWFS
jgi:hypothetical protein